MIREWCAACGERFVEQLLGNGETVVWCPRMCQCNDWNNAHYDAGQMAEAYGSLREGQRLTMDNSIEGTMFTFPAPWPIAIREVSVGDDGSVTDEIRTLRDGMLAAPFDHIVGSKATLVAIAKRVAGPEAAERVRLEIEALEQDTTEEEEGEG